MVLQCFPTLDETSLKNPSAPCLGPELKFSAEEFSRPDALREKKTCHCKYTHQWSKFIIVRSLMNKPMRAQKSSSCFAF